MTIDNEPGTYFRDIYADLTNRLPGFPAEDATPNLQECIRGANFVRAEMLATQHQLPSDLIAHLREMAMLQYIIDYRNFVGVEELIRMFELPRAEVSRIIGLIEEEKEYPCFSFSRHTLLAIDENWTQVWQKEYAPHIQHLVSKPSILSRLIEWAKGRRRA